MTDTHEQFLAHAREIQAKYASLRLSEADTRSYLIDPVLRLLGYAGVEHLRREVVGVVQRLMKTVASRRFEVAADPPPRQRPPQRRRPPTEKTVTRTPRRVMLADLVAAGLLPDGAPLEARVRGVTHVGRLRDGQIELNGAFHESPSAASLALREKPFNGWVDWRYKGERLADLRARLPGAAGQQTST